MPQHPSLEYASLADVDADRRWAACRLVGVGALLLAAHGCFEIAITSYALATLPGAFSQLDGWSVLELIKLASGPMLVVCAFLAFSQSTVRDVTGRLRMACTITATLILVLLAVRHARLLILLPGQVWPGLGIWSQLSAYASVLCLLMPLLLFRAKNASAWRARLLALASVTMLFAGLDGIGILHLRALDVQRSTDIAFGQALQIALRKPLPIVGLWPTAGFAAAALFAIAIFKPGRPLISTAVLLAAFFKLAVTCNPRFSLTGPMGGRWDEILRMEMSLRLLVGLICDLLSVVLVAWMLWREREPAPRINL